MLSQYDKNNEDHPIAYFSRKLLPREQRYSTVEKECPKSLLRWHNNTLVPVGYQVSMELA